MARASFSTLPLELKARIIEMASDQEDAWNRRVKGAEERVGHIDSLSSLALVNKEFRELAAKHQFDKLSSGRQSSQPIFRLHILPRYGHHVTQLTFLDREASELDYVLAIMSQLPSLRALFFTHGAAITLFGPAVALPVPSEQPGPAAYRTSILDHVSPRITFLTLCDFTPSTCVNLVRRFPNLSMLLLDSLGEAAKEEEVKSLIGAIASLRRLTHLVVDLAMQTTALGWTTEAFEPLKSDPLPLQALQLFEFPLDDHTINLVSIFESTLETLCLEVWFRQPHPPTRDPLRLPRLTSFNLSTHRDALKAVLSLFTTSANLSHFSLADSNPNVEPTDPTILSFLASQPNLVSFHLGHLEVEYPILVFNTRHLFPPSSLAAYADLVHSRNLHQTDLDQPHLTPFHPSANLDYTETEASYLNEALIRTLDFGRNEVERMFAEGNVARAVGWVAKLKALEDERLAWKD